MNEYKITAANPILSASVIIPQGTEVLRIEVGGRIFWNGREVVGDEMFREAMMDLNKTLKSTDRFNEGFARATASTSFFIPDGMRTTWP